MRHEIEVLPSPQAVARRAAEYVAERARAAVAGHGRFTFAISGGHTPWAMFDRLTDEDVPWERVVLYQVDERIAPAGDPDRNLTHLRESLGEVPAEVIAMPVNEPDQVEAADRYGALLPERFDLVHLGLGPDGRRVPGTRRSSVGHDRSPRRDHQGVPGPPTHDAHLPGPRPSSSGLPGAMRPPLQAGVRRIARRAGYGESVTHPDGRSGQRS